MSPIFRGSTMEEKRNFRKAFLYLILTVASLVAIFFLGIPLFAKFAGFLTTINDKNKTIQITDTTPPGPPSINPLPEFTNKTNVPISGTAEAGAEVVISLNNKESSVLADKSGNFSSSLALNKGENTVVAFAKDQAGNKSHNTQTFKITFDNEAPKIEISAPADGSKFFGSKQKTLTITGKTKLDSQLTINDRLVSVNDDGSFSFQTTLSEGENVFNINATDRAGNSSQKTLTVSYSL